MLASRDSSSGSQGMNQLVKCIVGVMLRRCWVPAEGLGAPCRSRAGGYRCNAHRHIATTASPLGC